MADSYEPNPLVIQAAENFRDSGRAELLHAVGSDPNALAVGFSNLPDRSDLIVYAGYLGGALDEDDKTWQLLYLDARLQSWLLVGQDDIIAHDKRKDDPAAEIYRDFIWVDGCAPIVRGAGPRSQEAKFLVGEFTRAADFAMSARGGTFSAATGLLCEATSPGCCKGWRTG